MFVIRLIITELSQFNTSFSIQFHSKLFVESQQVRAIESWICLRPQKHTEIVESLKYPPREIVPEYVDYFKSTDIKHEATRRV